MPCCMEVFRGLRWASYALAAPSVAGSREVSCNFAMHDAYRLQPWSLELHEVGGEVVVLCERVHAVQVAARGGMHSGCTDTGVGGGGAVDNLGALPQ